MKKNITLWMRRSTLLGKDFPPYTKWQKHQRRSQNLQQSGSSLTVRGLALLPPGFNRRNSGSDYSYNHHRFLIRTAPVDGVVQKFVPQSVLAHFVHAYHYLLLVENLAKCSMYDTM